MSNLFCMCMSTVIIILHCMFIMDMYRSVTIHLPMCTKNLVIHLFVRSFVEFVGHSQPLGQNLSGVGCLSLYYKHPEVVTAMYLCDVLNVPIMIHNQTLYSRLEYFFPSYELIHEIQEILHLTKIICYTVHNLVKIIFRYMMD